MARSTKPHIAVRYNVATHGRHIPRRVVIHDTECGDAPGTSEITGIAAFWERQGQGLGAHYIIDADGNIGQGCSPTQITWAVQGHNTGSVHIELVGFAKWPRIQWLRRGKQIRALVYLTAELCREYHIPTSHSTDTGVCMHRDFHGTHTDPGAGFPFRLVLRWTRRLVGRAAK